MAMGFGGVILHGLIAWNMTCHAILRSLCLTTKDNLKEFQARFAAPVKGNDKLIIEIWRMGEIEEGWEEVRFITRIEGGKVCLRNGRAVVRSVAGGLDESPPASTDMITAHKSSL
jgi:peroxisomal enoyl-CoA hydratase 2